MPQRPPRTPPDRPADHLRDDERRFRQLASLAPVGIFETDAEGNCLFVNEKWCELAGMGPVEAAGRGWVAALHPGDRERVFREWYEAAQDAREFNSEYRFGAGDDVTWLHGMARSLRGDDGEIIGYIGTVTSIDERKAVEAALRETDARLEAVLASIGDHLVTYDREWRYTYVNDPAAKVLGKSKEELLGRSIWEVFPEAVGNQYYDELHQALAEQRVIRSEHFYAPFDVWFENFIYPSAAGVTVFATDITWRKRLEQELRQRNERLAEADRLKDEFLALLAHELRNPLAPVRSALEVMRMPGASASAVARMRDVAERQLEHMARLLDDLLDVSRIGRGSIELRPDTVDLTSVIHRTIDTLRPSIEMKRQVLEVQLSADELLVRADPLRLEQILTNLLGNAVKYTPEDGRIALTVARSGDEVELRFRDSGIGISPSTLPKVFDLFVQAEHRIEGEGHRGVGVGLALVKKLVELHGGRVEAHSEGLGKGSEFVVHLPAAVSPDSTQRTREQAASRAAQSARLRVLVVDDNRDAADSLTLLLGLAGHEARTAYSGLEALALARELDPDVILLDLGMPGMDGYEVARELRRDAATKDATLVALTGWGQDEDRKRSAEAGFDHHLTKPVAFDVVQRVLAGLGSRA